MKKNTASQVVVAQLVSKTDGSAVTSGTTTVYVLGDGGTQATGSVGSGAGTHEGNGVWSYAPAQAETNYDHVAFTFVNSTAVNATVQVYTSFPQTGDGYARLGAPAGASHAADVAAVKAVLPAALVSGRIDASVGAMASGVLTATAIAADAITDAKVASDVTIASVTGAVGSVTGNVGGNVTGSVGSVVARVTANTDQLAGQTVTAAAGVTFPTSVASPTNITAGTITTVTNLTNAPSAGDFTATMKTSIGTAVAASAVASVTGNVGGNVTGSVGSVASGGIASSSFASGAITAAAIAADAIGASELAADAVAEIADAVWDEVLSGHLTSGTTGAALNAAGSAGDPWSTALPGAYGAGTAGKIVGDNLNATVSSRLASASYTAPLDAAGTRSAVGLASANLDTQLDALPTNAELTTALGTADDAVLAQVALVKAKTDSLTFTVSGKVDANITHVNDAEVTGDGTTGNEWGPL